MADDLPRTKIVIDVSVCTIRMKRFHRSDNFVFDAQKEGVVAFVLKGVAIEDPICSLPGKFPSSCNG
jgi:hypothetical protein